MRNRIGVNKTDQGAWPPGVDAPYQSVEGTKTVLTVQATGIFFAVVTRWMKLWGYHPGF